MTTESKIRILLVDDQPENLLVLEGILQSPKYELVKAESAPEALLLLLRMDFAVIVLDVLMPDMNGFEAARIIKQRAKSRLVPIIFLTAYGRNELDITEGYSAGAIDFLTKPVEPAILRAKVASFVELFEQREQLRALNGELRLSRRELQDTNRNLEEAIETLREANANLDSFAFSVSHDLRAPLRHADAYSSLLFDRCAQKLDEEEKRYLTSIRESVRRMGSMIEDLLNFSRVCRTDITHQPVSMDEMVRDVLSELRETFGERQIEIAVDPLPAADGDPAMLRHVWQNLLSNAVKYTRKREVAKIHVGSESDRPNEMTYFVQDNGVGFDMRYADRLFGVFQRLHTQAEYEGTGAGLAIVKRIVQRHNGRVYAEAAVDAGARFSFSLPKREEPTSAESPSPEGSPTEKTTWHDHEL